MCLLLAFFACAFPIRRTVGWLAASTLFYCFASAANVWLNSRSSYADIQPYDLMALKMFSEDAIGKLMVVIGGLMYFASINRKGFAAYGMIVASCFCAIDAFVVLVQFFMDPGHCGSENACGSLIGNPSMNACFIVVLLPLAMKTFDPLPRAITFFLVLAAVIISKASIPYGLLVAMVLLLAMTQASKRTLGIALLAAPAVALVAWKLLGAELLNSGDRFPMWAFFLSKFNVPANRIVGTGYGTFGVFSINIQQHFHMRENGWWIWCHEDFLQEYFEMGIVGVLLMLLTYLRALVLLVRDELLHEFVALALYGLMMSMNYPLHLAPTAVFGCWLALVALTSKKKMFFTRAKPSVRLVP